MEISFIEFQSNTRRIDEKKDSSERGDDFYVDWEKSGLEPAVVVRLFLAETIDLAVPAFTTDHQHSFTNRG